MLFEVSVGWGDKGCHGGSRDMRLCLLRSSRPGIIRARLALSVAWTFSNRAANSTFERECRSVSAAMDRKLAARLASLSGGPRPSIPGANSDELRAAVMNVELLSHIK
jgi:hypothetical protein